MVNRYTLGSIVLGIFLMAILGVSRAMSWLTQSNAKTGNQIVAVEADKTNVNGTTDINRISQGDNTSSSQSATSQSDATITSPADATGEDTIVLLPLEEAGTYIQRQKRVEEDKTIAQTEINVVPVANNNVPAAESDTITPNVPASTSAAPSQTRPTTSAPAVPALW
ncbi:MAG: hypothetical protein AAGC93_22160 [Cyanobacteria bacterium P01_F01_bin.53]